MVERGRKFRTTADLGYEGEDPEEDEDREKD